MALRFTLLPFVFQSYSDWQQSHTSAEGYRRSLWLHFKRAAHHFTCPNWKHQQKQIHVNFSFIHFGIFLHLIVYWCFLVHLNYVKWLKTIRWKKTKYFIKLACICLQLDCSKFVQKKKKRSTPLTPLQINSDDSV